MAAGIRTSDIGAWYSVEVSSAPRRHSRGKKYFLDEHTGHPCSGPSSNRLEEHLAIALWHCFRGRQMALPNGGEMVFVDYQVPLKALRSDLGIGKIDLFGTVDVSSSCSGRVCELKIGHRDTPLKAILECLTYRAIAEANLADISDELGKRLTDLECLVLAPVEYWSWFASERSAGNWTAEIKSLLERIEADLGIKCSLLALENCQWTVGLNGDAPLLSYTPTAREALGGNQNGSGFSNEFKIREQRRQAEFRAVSCSITGEGRQPNDDSGRRVPYLLALGHEEENLMPELRGSGGAVDFFRERDIRWWKERKTGSDLSRRGPTRNLLSSQIACVNVLMSLASDREALLLMLRSVDPQVADIVPITSTSGSTLVEFEWCGLESSLEGRPALPRRVRHQCGCSDDRASWPGTPSAPLLEWKYIEFYEEPVSLAIGESGKTRLRRYSGLYQNSTSFNSERIPITEFFDDPLYQLMRLRLLGDRMAIPVTRRK